MWADRPSGGGGDNSSLSNPSANNASSKSVIATPYDDFEFDLKYDSPSRALDEVSANDALMICYAAASGHEMDQRFPRLGRRFGKDDVVVDIQPTDVGYTWGMFDYTVRQLESILRTQGFMSCSWEIIKIDGRKMYARGSMWSVGGKRGNQSEDVATA